MSANASEIISRHKFKILSGITAVAGTSAAAGTYFMPSSEDKHIMTPQLANVPKLIVNANSNEAIEPTQTIEESVQKVENQIEEEPKTLEEVKPLSAPVKPDAMPKVNESPKPSPEVPAANTVVTTIQSAGQPSETEGVVKYQAGEFGSGKTWSDQEAIPHDAPLSEWKTHEDDLIKSNTLNDGNIIEHRFVIPEFQEAYNRIKDSNNRSGNIWKTTCTKHYRLNVSDMDITDPNKKTTKDKAIEVANWCGRRRKGLTE